MITGRSTSDRIGRALPFPQPTCAVQRVALLRRCGSESKGAGHVTGMNHRIAKVGTSLALPVNGVLNRFRKQNSFQQISNLHSARNSLVRRRALRCLGGGLQVSTCGATSCPPRLRPFQSKSLCSGTIVQMK
jgi:hypothetical protein